MLWSACPSGWKSPSFVGSSDVTVAQVHCFVESGWYIYVLGEGSQNVVKSTAVAIAQEEGRCVGVLVEHSMCVLC